MLFRHMLGSPGSLRAGRHKRQPGLNARVVRRIVDAKKIPDRQAAASREN